MTSLRYRKPTSSLVCHTGGICYDAEEVKRHAEVRLALGFSPQTAWRCPNAEGHPQRPYHVGRRLTARRAA